MTSSSHPQGRLLLLASLRRSTSNSSSSLPHYACEYHRESGLKYLDEDEGAFSDDDEDGVECFWKRSSGKAGDVILNDDAMIIPEMADIEGSNGYVHAIDKVLLPPSIVNVDKNLYEVASADSDFSTAAEILAQFELDEFFEGRGPFTVSAFGGRVRSSSYHYHHHLIAAFVLV